MAPITSKQWRALLQAFPVYGIDPSSRERRQEFITEGGAERVGQAFLLPLEATADDGDVPLNLDQWLRGVFGLAPLTKKKKKDTTSLSNIPSLTENERVLLSLWWRERQRVDQYYSMYDELRERVESMRQQPSPSRLGESSTMVDGSRVFVSAIAHLPVANNTPGTTLGAGEPIRCEVCQDADGELYQCASCRSIRHEACGGPHPDEALSKNPTGTPQSDGPAHRMLCVDCRRTLNCDSSSSSLRSSTSSDERAELAALYGEDDDEDTSLSGFIAEDEEDEEEDEEGLDSAASSRSGPFTSRHLSERQPLYEPHSDEDEEMLLRGDGARRPQRAKASPPAAAVRSSATPRTKNKVKRPRDYSCSSSESSS